jgi:hypothetical protein
VVNLEDNVMASRTFAPRPALASLWFPAALVVLLLLAVPAAVLLALTLFGKQNAVNGWLQEHLGLSYHLPLPWWAGLLLLLVPLLLVLLYFLKLKRKPLQVPSTFLWRKSIDDLRVNSLFQWLRDNVLLLVQLLTVLLLLYGVMAFQVHGRTSTGRHYILLIDSSASMAVQDVGPSRLDEAKQEAVNEIDAHADGDSGMVIGFNARAQILQPYTTDKGLLRAAVAGIRQTRRPTRVEEALSLADSLANPLRSTDDAAVRPANEDPSQARTYVAAEGIAAEVHLFSDGRFPDVPSFAAGNLNLHYHRIGRPGPDAVDNLGIVTLNAVRDERDPGRLQVFVRVLNYRKDPATARVELEWRLPDRADFNLREQEVALPGRTLTPGSEDKGEPPADTPGEGVTTFDLGDVDDSANVVLHARLRDVRDQFPLDDEAWLVVGVVRKARVLIVTEGNEILSDFFDLEATGKVADVRYLKPADLKDENKYLRPARDGAYDLVVFDRCAPEHEDGLPLGNTFFIDTVPPPWKRADMPLLKGAPIRNPASDHPLMRNLTALDEIAFSEAFRFDLKDARVPPRTPRLLETDRETAVLFVLARRSFQDLVLTFPLVNARGQWTTTWNLKLSFPVFLRNVLYTLGNVEDAAAEENVQPGQVKVLRPAVAVRRLEVFPPGGGPAREVARGAQAEFLYKDTEEVGVYRAAWPGGGRNFAVNLLDADESNVQPRDEVRIGSQALAAGASQRQTYETWKWVALAALVLLLLEWALYHRRMFF